MKIQIDGVEMDIESIDPREVATLLSRSGWAQRGGRENAYTRWILASEEQSAHPATVILPLDRAMQDYTDLLTDSLSTLTLLASQGNQPVQLALARLTQAPGDELRFRKNVETIRGAVPWPTGEDLFAAARGILVAGAKTRVSRRAYYGQTNGGFAKRFLESVLMGQTELGSYVVTAFTPSQKFFPERESKGEKTQLPNVGSYSGREIVYSIVQSLESTQEALAHFKKTQSYSGFKENVRKGVSREMTESLYMMALGSESADVTVELALPMALLEPSEEAAAESFRTFTFSGDDAEALQQASMRLRSAAPTKFVNAIGWLSVVARPKRGQAGIVRMKVLEGSDAQTLQVRLTEEQFEIAAAAITADQGVSVSGRQEKDGNRYWLYNATDLKLVDLPRISRGPRVEVPPGQAELDL